MRTILRVLSAVTFAVWFQGQAAEAAVRVAVIATTDAQSLDTMKQLNDSTKFAIQAEMMPIETAAIPGSLDAYDVVLTGWTNQYAQFSPAFIASLTTFLNGGGGWVATAWLSNILIALNSPDAVALSPVVVNADYLTGDQDIVITGSHVATQGITNFRESSSFVEYAQALAPGARTLATIGTDKIVAAVKDVGSGHSVFLGFFYHQSGDYEATGLRTGVPDTLLEQVVAFAGERGSRHSCLAASEHLKCWGSSKFGQLGVAAPTPIGDGPNEVSTLRPIELGADFRVADFSTGVEFTCALSATGVVKCFGRNDVGQLGLGDSRPRGSLTTDMGEALPGIALGEAAKQIVSGDAHSCALLANGAVKCWGGNTAGQLGQGNTLNVGAAAGEVPVLVALGRGHVAQLTASGRHTCARFEDGQVKCWGNNALGQLGLGDTPNRGDQPNQMGDVLPFVALGAGFHATSISASDSGVCALSDANQIKCWGDGNSGQLGKESRTVLGDQPNEMGDALPLVNLGESQLAETLSCGAAHCCATFVQGSMKCWGANFAGQLGLGDSRERGADVSTMADELPFVHFKNLESVARLRATRNRTCAETQSGWRCWGENTDGQLGVGDLLNRGDQPNGVPYFLAPLPL